MARVDFFAHDPDAVIEPWQPQVGDRVRVRINGECRATGWLDYSDGYETVHGEHYPQEDGRTGTVHAIESVPCQGHPYLVDFDKSFIHEHPHPGRCIGAAYAACELEPLTEEGR